MNLLALQAWFTKPWTEHRFRTLLDRQFRPRPTVELVRKLEEFRYLHHQAEAGQQAADTTRYHYYIQALEWVLNGHDTAPDKPVSG